MYTLWRKVKRRKVAPGASLSHKIMMISRNLPPLPRSLFSTHLSCSPGIFFRRHFSIH